MKISFDTSSTIINEKGQTQTISKIIDKKPTESTINIITKKKHGRKRQKVLDMD